MITKTWQLLKDIRTSYAENFFISNYFNIIVFIFMPLLTPHNASLEVNSFLANDHLLNHCYLKITKILEMNLQTYFLPLSFIICSTLFFFSLNIKVRSSTLKTFLLFSLPGLTKHKFRVASFSETKFSHKSSFF